jgi:hypothetical protein
MLGVVVWEGEGDSSTGMLMCFVSLVACAVYKVLGPCCMVANAPRASCSRRGFHKSP